MKLTLYKENDIQDIYEFDYARCGLNGWIYFYKNDWSHYCMGYDFLTGVAKLYTKRECVYSYRVIRKIRAIKIE